MASVRLPIPIEGGRPPRTLASAPAVVGRCEAARARTERGSNQRRWDRRALVDMCQWYGAGYFLWCTAPCTLEA